MALVPVILEIAELAPELLELGDMYFHHLTRKANVSFVNKTTRRIRIECDFHHAVLEPYIGKTSRDWAYSILWGEEDVTIWCSKFKDATKVLVCKGDLVKFHDGKILIYGLDGKLKKALRLPDGPLAD